MLYKPYEKSSHCICTLKEENICCISQLENLDQGKQSFPDGILKLKDVGVFDEGIFDKIRVIYLDISEDKLKERLSKRGDSLCEINRRLEADRNDFEKLNGFEPLYRLNCANMNPIDICKTIINLR